MMTALPVIWSGRSRAVPPLAAALLVAALAGCAGVPVNTAQQEAAWQRHAAWVRAQHDWRLAGRFALKIGHRGWTASLHWRERGGDYRIDIFDPLGRTVAQLDGGPQRVTLRADGSAPRQAGSAAALMQAELGWSLPVAGLRYWVRGVPAPGSQPTRMRFDGSGRLTSLVQSGWEISYLDYNEALGARALPARLRLVNGDVRLTLLVDRWGAAQ
ncbi:MAG: lipoprotein insertase outer membrane protein LolB [Acidihalobacter sp.]